MPFRSLSCAAALVLALTGFTGAAYASPITYQISSVASGTIGGSAFSNAAVTLTATGDTANVVSSPGVPYLAMALNTATLSIAGIGTATITDPTEIFSTVISVQLDPTFPALAGVVIGKVDNPPSLSSFTGIGAVASNALLGYDLRTSIGPITGSPGGIEFIIPCGVPGSDPCLNTTLGTLSFAARVSPTSVGTFSARAATAPEPAAFFLMASAAAALIRHSRSRKRA